MGEPVGVIFTFAEPYNFALKQLRNDP